MKTNRFFKITLVIIALLLALNLLQGQIYLCFEEKAIAATGQTFSPISHVVCSSCGKYVYIVRGKNLLRSEDFGYSWIQLLSTW